jgi:type IV secretory pathway TrbD component
MGLKPAGPPPIPPGATPEEVQRIMDDYRDYLVAGAKHQKVMFTDSLWLLIVILWVSALIVLLIWLFGRQPLF